VEDHDAGRKDDRDKYEERGFRLEEAQILPADSTTPAYATGSLTER
jgi:hypothetical protein